MKQVIEVKNATAADIREYYGQNMPMTLKAEVFKIGDKIKGVFGIFRIGAQMVMFSDVKPELNLKSIPVLRSIKRMQKMAKESKLPVLATSDELFGPDLLERMGFEKVEGEIYVWIN